MCAGRACARGPACGWGQGRSRLSHGEAWAGTKTCACESIPRGSADVPKSRRFDTGVQNCT